MNSSIEGRIKAHSRSVELCEVDVIGNEGITNILGQRCTAKCHDLHGFQHIEPIRVFTPKLN